MKKLFRPTMLGGSFVMAIAIFLAPMSAGCGSSTNQLGAFTAAESACYDAEKVVAIMANSAFSKTLSEYTGSDKVKATAFVQRLQSFVANDAIKLRTYNCADTVDKTCPLKFDGLVDFFNCVGGDATASLPDNASVGTLCQVAAALVAEEAGESVTSFGKHLKSSAEADQVPREYILFFDSKADEIVSNTINKCTTIITSKCPAAIAKRADFIKCLADNWGA